MLRLRSSRISKIVGEAALAGRRSIFRLLTTASICLLAAAQMTSESPAEIAARWVAANAIPIETVEAGHDFRDLQPLKQIVGNARIVALGESTHGTREFFQLKHRVFEFLVREMGFTVMAMESPLPEAFDLNQYVLTGKGDPIKALSNTHNWRYDTEEILDLIRWMRDYNSDPVNVHKLKFYGFDMQSSARAAKVVLAYLRRVDPEEASAVEPVLRLLSNPLTNEDYALSKSRIEQCTVVTAGILNRFEERRPAYVRGSSAGEWSMVRQNTRVLAQFLELSGAGDNRPARDRSMAANVEWVLNEEGPRAKVVLWAHNYHVAVQTDHMGDSLRKRFANAIVVLGITFNQGVFRAFGGDQEFQDYAVHPAQDGTLEATLAAAHLPVALIPFHKLPTEGPAMEWFNSELPARQISSYSEADEASGHLPKVRAASAYDAMFFIDRTSAAHPLPGGKRPTRTKLDAPANLGFEIGERNVSPPDWISGPPMFVGTAYQSELGFHVAVSDGQHHLGRKSAMIRRQPEEAYGEDAGGLEQMIDARPYRGKHIQLKAAVRTVVSGPGNQAHLWLRVSGKHAESSFFDADLDHPITANRWRYFRIRGDVDQNAETIEYGLALIGAGQVFLDDVSLRVVP
jgi:erythromycin esterase